ncbi:MAG TPA: DUF3426 domain-containing protein [Rhizomicrobium sp.]|jgi:predicted Zn finger-like uncharacterized protein|nr:DUF3426 domain-containing protein [Rhizomicrobium sp.]
MILTCPQCATRYQADGAKFLPAGRNVRCAKCGHLWRQEPPPAETDAPADLAVVEAAPPPAAPSAARPAAYAPDPIAARDIDAALPATRARWPMRLAVAAGWAGLIAIVLVVGWSAYTFREQVATVWPQSASLYAALGLKANASGIDIKDVRYRRDVENGQTVLAVTGVLENSSARELPAPQMRAALFDNDRRELYHWTFFPGVMTLEPGQSTKFVTRLSNPPDGARRFELRFARAGE